MSKETKSHLERMNHWVIFALIAKASFISKMLKYLLGLGTEDQKSSGKVPSAPLLPQPSPTFLLLTPVLLRKHLETQRENSLGLISASSPATGGFRKIFTPHRETQKVERGLKKYPGSCVFHMKHNVTKPAKP